jgi:hypothetical protein
LVSSRKPLFKEPTVPANTFSSFWPIQHETWVKSRNRCSKGRLALKIHCLSYGRPKMRLERVRESDVSML